MLGKPRKKRRKSMSSTLKFEVYGILLLIFSVITLAREGSVGESIAFLFRVLVGNWEPVLSAILIYIAVYHLMIKRSWPSGWSVKYTGVLLFLLGLMISAHSGLFRTLMPDGGFTASWIVSQTWAALESHWKPTGIEFTVNAGGGMIGGLLFAALYILFGHWGAQLVQIALYAVGVLLITGWSYVQVASAIKRILGRTFRSVGSTTMETIQLLQERTGQASSPAEAAVVRRRSNRQQAPIPIDDEFDEETWKPDKLKRQRKWFFSLGGFSASKTKKEEGVPAQVASEPPVRASFPKERPAIEAETEETVLYSVPAQDPAFKTEADSTMEPEFRHEPVFVDFLDHVRQSVHETTGETEAANSTMTSAPLAEQLDESASNPKAVGGEPLTISAQRDAGAEPVQLRVPYVLPPFHLLSRPGGGKGTESADSIARENARKLEMTLESFNVGAKVLQVVRGPAVTRYEIQPDIGVKVSRIVSLTDDIALALAAKDIRMEAPIPGKSAIGIEVPNTEVSVVTLREVMESSAFHESDSRMTIALGRDISGTPIVANLAKMPHLLVAGATGSGKSVCINGIITSVLYKAKPDEVKFLMIDPKMVELNVYNGIPHLLAPVVTDPRRASLALKKVVVEMEKRYELFSKSGTRNIEGYNAQLVEKGETPLPYIIVIVDELADLMMVAANDVEDAICRLAQMARAAGIHLIIATQRPSVDVITGVIKANIPSRIAFGVSSQVDSRTILDMAGAEKLLGRGDMLFMPVGASKAVRVQGAFLSDQEVEAVVTFCRDQEKAEYREEMVPEIQENDPAGNEQLDELFDQAVGIVFEAKQASVSLLQRRMRIGYARAARLIDQMEAKGVVGPYEGSKPREVLVSQEQYQSNRLSS